MQIRDIMSTDCKWCTPSSTITEAAELMAQEGIGSVPIAENDKLVGIVTDRDIVVRGLATGKDPQKAQLRDLMTDKVYYCFDDQSSDEVATNMADMQIRRLVVVTRDKQLAGIVSLGDLARKTEPSEAHRALHGISRAS